MAHRHTEKLSIVEIAKIYAIRKHRFINQMYDIHPYSYHLDGVYNVGEQFIYLIPVDDQPDVLAGTWTHDIIEDTPENYQDVKKATNETVAEYAFRLTNPKGRNRAERNSVQYYEEIKEYKHAAFIKLCDRIANIRYSATTGGSMFLKYLKEHPEFKEKLYDGRYQEMWDYLETILENGKS